MSGEVISMVVHGGAWAIPDNLVEASLIGVEKAVKVGFAVLSEGRKATCWFFNSTDAFQEARRWMLLRLP
jgi:hypothetical protein